jgi:methyl-accepting chemotaxis protein
MVAKLRDVIGQAEDKSRLAAQETDRAHQAMAAAEAAGRRAEAGRTALLEAARRLESLAEDLSTSSEKLSAQVEQTSHGAQVQKSRAQETVASMGQMRTAFWRWDPNAAILEPSIQAKARPFGRRRRVNTWSRRGRVNARSRCSRTR